MTEAVVCWNNLSWLERELICTCGGPEGWMLTTTGDSPGRQHYGLGCRVSK